MKGYTNAEGKNPMMIAGPQRVFPGRLSVSRSFGDITAKRHEFGGNPSVLIAEPEINVFRLCPEADFIVMGSDGLFDKLSNVDLVELIWNESVEPTGADIHHHIAHCVEESIEVAMDKNSLDNLSSVIIAFKNFKKAVFPRKTIFSPQPIQAEKQEALTHIPGMNKALDGENHSVAKDLSARVRGTPLSPTHQLQGGLGSTSHPSERHLSPSPPQKKYFVPAKGRHVKEEENSLPGVLIKRQEMPPRVPFLKIQLKKGQKLPLGSGMGAQIMGKTNNDESLDPSGIEPRRQNERVLPLVIKSQSLRKR